MGQFSQKKYINKNLLPIATIALNIILAFHTVESTANVNSTEFLYSDTVKP